MADQKKSTNKTLTLKEAIKQFVHDGCSVTLGGFCGRNSQAASYEIVLDSLRD